MAMLVSYGYAAFLWLSMFLVVMQVSCGYPGFSWLSRYSTRCHVQKEKLKRSRHSKAFHLTFINKFSPWQVLPLLLVEEDVYHADMDKGCEKVLRKR